MDKAKNILIEITGRCNAKCPYCAQARGRKIRNIRRNMSSTLFEQVLEHLLNINIIDDSVKTISLFNFGEPSLNPEMNTILKILKRNNLGAAISSNFITPMKLDENCFDVIKSLTFSLSGFSQESYGRIHGASLEKTLNNFTRFYEKGCKLAPEMKVNVAWHRYSFNEHEFWDAFEYFSNLGISFLPTMAYLNDLVEFLDFVKGVLPETRLEQVKEDLFLNKIQERLNYSRQRSTNYKCPGTKDWLTIDQTGQLLVCCGFAGWDTKYALGNITEMSAEEIWDKKTSQPICIECTSTGIPRWVYHGRSIYFEKSWPSGKASNYLKFLSQNGSFREILAKSTSYLPDGIQLKHHIKNVLHL